MSPTLFNEALKFWRRYCGLIEITLNEYTVFIRFYVDDQTVLIIDSTDLSYIVKKLEEIFKIFGLIINLTKSECLSKGKNDVDG